MSNLVRDSKYTDAAFRPGEPDPHPDKPVGEFISIVASNDWVNDEYKLIVIDVPW